jgi:tetraacyldisaccharide 4'-kinase
MASEAPPFWWERPDWRAYALSPVAFLYARVASWRMRNAPMTPTGLPVLCVGNPTVGGSGKTPLAIAFAREARALGYHPGFLTRGYGGTLHGSHLVDLAHDSAKATGDEPILLARHAPTAVTPDRAAGARLLAAEGCDFLIMDDGFQTARIRYDYAVLVVDARRGVGNGFVIPAGPLRAPLVEHVRRMDALVRMGEGAAADEVVRAAARAARPVYDAKTRPRPDSGVEGGRFLAFAGIGDPEKFYETVQSAGGELVLRRSFGDHHLYTDDDLSTLLADAEAAGLDLVTTEKDAVRIRRTSETGARLLDRLKVVEIDAIFDAPGIASRIIRDTIAAFEARNGR